MNKIVRGIKAIGSGFMPVSKIKGTLIVVILIYGIFLAFQLRQDLGTTRHVLLENKQTGGNVVLNGVKHVVPYTITKTRVKFDVADPLDFLFLPNGDYNESFITALTKLIICVLALRLFLTINITDPFSNTYYKQARLLIFTIMVTVFAYIFEYFYLGTWTGGVYNGLGDFKTINSYTPFHYIAMLWILRAMFSFYKAAVKTRREAELTI
jgi:hypothetical protein